MGKCRHEQGLDDEGLCFLCLESGDDIYFDLQQRLAIQERINQNALGRIKELEKAAREVIDSGEDSHYCLLKLEALLPQQEESDE